MNVFLESENRRLKVKLEKAKEKNESLVNENRSLQSDLDNVQKKLQSVMNYQKEAEHLYQIGKETIRQAREAEKEYKNLCRKIALEQAKLNKEQASKFDELDLIIKKANKKHNLINK